MIIPSVFTARHFPRRRLPLCCPCRADFVRSHLSYSASLFQPTSNVPCERLCELKSEIIKSKQAPHMKSVLVCVGHFGVFFKIHPHGEWREEADGGEEVKGEIPCGADLGSRSAHGWMYSTITQEDTLLCCLTVTRETEIKYSGSLQVFLKGWPLLGRDATKFPGSVHSAEHNPSKDQRADASYSTFLRYCCLVMGLEGFCAIV